MPGNFFIRIVGFFKKLIAKKKKQESITSKKDNIPAHMHMPASADPGLKCPRCGNKIKISIEMLLSQQPIYCTSCFLKLSVDKDKSQEALTALNKLQSGFQRANEMVKQNS